MNRNHIQFVMLFGVLCWSGVAGAVDFAGGTGQPDDPYQIATAEQLMSIGSDPNLLAKSYVLITNIDLDPCLPGGRVFRHAVIAPDLDESWNFEGVPFSGSFDGGGYKIRGLTIDGLTIDPCDPNDTLRYYLGLFGKIDSQGSVHHLTITDANIYADVDSYPPCVRVEQVGILAGWNEGDVSFCLSSGSLVAQCVGGLIGRNAGSVSHCSSTAVVAGGFPAGRFGGNE